ncbi:hypothetical protein BH09GEM1_BH09GEM1_15960 [soil metagenome]
MDFETPVGATPLDPDEAIELVPSHLTTMQELNEWESANILAAERWTPCSTASGSRDSHGAVETCRANTPKFAPGIWLP